MSLVPKSVGTVAEVERVLADIRDCAGDDEAAHGMEDALHEAVLLAIASGDHVDSPGELAAAALKTREIEFSRWCA